MEAKLTIYHNAQCSKSTGALDILTERGVPFNVRYYLDDPLTAEELKALLKKLTLPASAIVRRGEATAAQFTANGEPDEEAWVQILSENPALLERPIAERGDKAVIARPPERVLELP